MVRKDNPNTREEKDLSDFQLILEVYKERGYDKGVMGIYMRLLRKGIRMNHKKIRRLMRKYGLNCPIRKANPYRRMPLRYNNDKQKKPLFSRGLSVCRLLFNSFSKLKIDENYKEKRRLFY